ncbi:hypothetical protein CLBKND_00795 [Methylorubrum aminovorans]
MIWLRTASILKVQAPITYQLVVNDRTARELSLMIRMSILAGADESIG